MRLICGLLRLDGVEAGEDLPRAMLDHMDTPRLRASRRVWRQGPVCLAVLDFTAKGAPAAELPGLDGSTIAADARLDGGADKGGDAVLLASLASRGPAALAGIDGDFSFALWNDTSQTLLCGRDHFGIRPFAYVHQSGKLFAFASLPGALHGGGVVPKTINKDAFLRRLQMNFKTGDNLVAGIERLPAAHYLEVSRHGLAVKRYWSLDRSMVGTRKCGPEEAAGQLRALVDDAVKRRLPGAGEVGAHLSGGLDSSSLAVLAARHLREEGRALHAYSFLDRQRNDITLEDETEFVKAVLAQERDIDWTPIRPAPPSGETLPIDPDKMHGLSNLGPEDQVCARAEAQGVGVILSGWGGDEGATFNGRGTLAEMFKKGRWVALSRELNALKRVRGWPVAQTLRNEVLSEFAPAGLIEFVKKARGKKTDFRNSLTELLTPKARAQLEAATGDRLEMTGDGRENRWRLMTGAHIAERAEVWAQTGARHGLAFVFPLLDRRVVEFAMSLPSELFLRDGFRRRPFRDAMADVLPEMVRQRHAKYTPFPSSMIDLVDRKDELLAKLDGYRKNPDITDVVDLDRVRALIAAFPSADTVREEMKDGDNPKESLMIITAMRMMGAAAYLEQHGERAGLKNTGP